MWGYLTEGQGPLSAVLWRRGPGGILEVGKLLEGEDFFWTSGRNDETKGKNSKQVNEFIPVFLNSKQSLVLPPLFAEPALSRIPQAASSLPAILGPGRSPASRRTPSGFPSLAELFFASHSERSTPRAAGSTPRSHTRPGLRTGEGVGDPLTRGKLPLGQ